MLDAVHHHEQTDEEEDRDPFNVAEGLMDVVCGLLSGMRPIVEQHQHRGTEHRDRRGLQVQRPRQHEGDHHQRNDRKRLLQQQPVLDRFGRIHRHDARFAFGCRA